MNGCKNHTPIGQMCQMLGDEHGCGWKNQLGSTGKLHEKSAVKRLKKGDNFLEGCLSANEIRSTLLRERR